MGHTIVAEQRCYRIPRDDVITTDPGRKSTTVQKSEPRLLSQSLHAHGRVGPILHLDTLGRRAVRHGNNTPVADAARVAEVTSVVGVGLYSLAERVPWLRLMLKLSTTIPAPAVVFPIKEAPQKRGPIQRLG